MIDREIETFEIILKFLLKRQAQDKCKQKEGMIE